mmetsp:Transcript_104711/g.240097  ORF Transcript_104711/g.240097 Transcript_104711/m.240097 type:complete len:324 (+) Transcript_104711:66-1037(+)
MLSEGGGDIDSEEQFFINGCFNLFSDGLSNGRSKASRQLIETLMVPTRAGETLEVALEQEQRMGMRVAYKYYKTEVAAHVDLDKRYNQLVETHRGLQASYMKEQVARDARENNARAEIQAMQKARKGRRGGLILDVPLEAISPTVTPAPSPTNAAKGAKLEAPVMEENDACWYDPYVFLDPELKEICEWTLNEKLKLLMEKPNQGVRRMIMQLNLFPEVPNWYDLEREMMKEEAAAAGRAQAEGPLAARVAELEAEIEELKEKLASRKSKSKRKTAGAAAVEEDPAAAIKAARNEELVLTLTDELEAQRRRAGEAEARQRLGG